MNTEQQEILDKYIDYNLRMMVLSGALVATRKLEHGWWCVQFEGGDPIEVDHSLAMMLARGFALGVKYSNNYKDVKRDLVAMINR